MTFRRPWLFMLVAGLLATAGCTGPGKIPRLTSGNSADAASSCLHDLPASGLQLHHQAQFTDAEGGTLFFQSVTRIDDGARRVRSVILSPEALVLFDGEVTLEGVRVLRALGPFANPQLSRWLLNDVALVYLPAGQAIAYGESGRGCRICRHRHCGDMVVDRLTCPDGSLTLRQYDVHGKLVRSVKYDADVVWTPDRSDTVPSGFELQAFGQIAYQIKFRLIDLQQVQ